MSKIFNILRVWLIQSIASFVNFREFIKLRLIIYSQNGYLGRGIISHGEYINILGKVYIKKGVRIECYPKFYGNSYEPELQIGDGVYIGYNVTVLVADKLVIKKDTILASNVTITTENHGMNPNSDTPYHAQKLIIGSVVIGRGCWIGQNAIILPNVHIGDKVIIGANAVVSRNVPDYCIAAGNPAKIIKRFDFDHNEWRKTDKEGAFID